MDGGRPGRSRLRFPGRPQDVARKCAIELLDVIVSQPKGFSAGETTVVPQSSVTVDEEAASQGMIPAGATVEELVQALTAIGSTPRDIIAIMQSIAAAGALEAELQVM